MSLASGSLRIEKISKRYRIRDAAAGRQKIDFWALRDVTFSVSPGEVLGVVGRNGAGKSTLLKVLSRIVQPTRGKAEISGRLAGLLEVGTGFHPELTGRENVYLNGTLLGMTRREVQTNFDAIVEFADLASFLDTPIKRYSSGMYVRLAFAVAAHLSNEILVMDEVLAVGDAQFQAKCLSKIDELAHDAGRTVLLVSHNAEVIRLHASRAVRLETGRLVQDASVPEVLAAHLGPQSMAPLDVRRIPRVDPNWGQRVRIVELLLVNPEMTMGEHLVYDVTVVNANPEEFGFGQAVTTDAGRPVGASFSRPTPVPAGKATFRVTVDSSDLAPGNYSLNIVVGRASLANPDLHYDGVLQAVTFAVLPPTGLLVDWRPEWWGETVLKAPIVEPFL